MINSDCTSVLNDSVLMEYSSQYLSEARPGIWCMCFSPNGRYLAVGDTTTYRIIVYFVLSDRLLASLIFPGVGYPEETNPQHIRRS